MDGWCIPTTVARLFNVPCAEPGLVVYCEKAIFEPEENYGRIRFLSPVQRRL